MVSRQSVLVGEGQADSALSQPARRPLPGSPAVHTVVTVEGLSQARGGTQANPVVKSRVLQGSVFHTKFCNRLLGSWQTLKEVRQGHDTIMLICSGNCLGQEGMA